MMNPRAAVWDTTTRCFFEAWYFTMHHRRSGHSFWIRYSLLAPEALDRSSLCTMWFFRFAPGLPHVAIKKDYDIGYFRTAEAPLVSIKGSRIEQDAIVGRIDSNPPVEWNIKFASNGPVYQHVPALYRPVSKAKVCATDLDAAVTGKIVVGDETYELNDRGQFAHKWGTRYPAWWGWAHCNDFDNGSGVVEVLSSRLSWSPTLTSIYARVDGREYRLNGPLACLKNRNVTRAGLRGWRVQATTATTMLRYDITTEERDIVGVRYRTPQDTAVYCYNTESASSKLTIQRRRFFGFTWNKVAEIESKRTTAFEFAQREAIPGIPTV